MNARAEMPDFRSIVDYLMLLEQDNHPAEFLAMVNADRAKLESWLAAQPLAPTDFTATFPNGVDAEGFALLIDADGGAEAVQERACAKDQGHQ